MAIVRSHSVAGARKSAGMITYRQVRGRTIASQKRAQSGKIPSKDQTLRHMTIKLLGLMGKIYGQSIKNSFDKTRFGNEYNLFAKDNYNYFRALLTFEASEGSDFKTKLGPWTTLYDAMLNNMQQTAFAGWKDVLDTAMNSVDTFSYTRIDKGDVYEVRSGANWDESEDPIPQPSITAVNVSVSSAGGAGLFDGLTITSGQNLPAGMTVKVAEEVIDGSWTNTNTLFTPTGQHLYYGTSVIYIYYNNRLLFSKSVEWSNEIEGE